MDYLSISDTILSIAYSPAKVIFFTPTLSATLRDTPTLDDIVTGSLDAYVDTQRETSLSIQRTDETMRVILFDETMCTFVDMPLDVFTESWENVPVC